MTGKERIFHRPTTTRARNTLSGSTNPIETKQPDYSSESHERPGSGGFDGSAVLR
jgi:hypothetical protein